MAFSEVIQRGHVLATSAKSVRSNVLIVEDEQTSRRALAALMTASGYDIEATATAEEALDVVDSGIHPDIALVDLDLPGMNGLDFIERMRERQPDVFTVMITAANGENLPELLKSRGVAYLRKPLNFDRLLSLLDHKATN